MQQHKLELKLSVCFTSKWRVGAGEGSFIVDRLIQRDSRAMPYIPGSALKGVIRESCEKLSRSLGFPEPADPHKVKIESPEFFGPLDQAPSPVDRLFGNKYEEGGLFFRDARLPDDAVLPPFFFQTRTRINRKLGTVRDAHLFSSQYAMPLKLTTTISGWHQGLVGMLDEDPPYAYAILIAAIKMVDRIGGDKSAGSGAMKDGLEIESIHYNDKSIPVEQYMNDTLMEYLDPSDYVDMRSEQ